MEGFKTKSILKISKNKQTCKKLSFFSPSHTFDLNKLTLVVVNFMLEFFKEPGVSFLLLVISYNNASCPFIYTWKTVYVEMGKGLYFGALIIPLTALKGDLVEQCETLYIISNAIDPIQIPAFPVWQIFVTSRKLLVKVSLFYNTMKSWYWSICKIWAV